MKITVHEAKQRTRNEISFDEVKGIITELASNNGFKPSISSRSELQLTDKSSTIRIPLKDLGFKEASGGKLVADKSSASVLTKLAKILQGNNSGNATKMAKACNDKASGLRG